MMLKAAVIFLLSATLADAGTYGAAEACYRADRTEYRTCHGIFMQESELAVNGVIDVLSGLFREVQQRAGVKALGDVYTACEQQDRFKRFFTNACSTLTRTVVRNLKQVWTAEREQALQQAVDQKRAEYVAYYQRVDHALAHVRIRTKLRLADFNMPAELEYLDQVIDLAQTGHRAYQASLQVFVDEHDSNLVYAHRDDVLDRLRDIGIERER